MHALRCGSCWTGRGIAVRSRAGSCVAFVSRLVCCVREQAESLPESSRWQVRRRRTPPPDHVARDANDPEGVEETHGLHGRTVAKVASATPSGSKQMTGCPIPWAAPRLHRSLPTITVCQPFGLYRRQAQTPPKLSRTQMVTMRDEAIQSFP